jgi:hypothetical protein
MRRDPFNCHVGIPCRLCIHLAFTYFVGPSSVVWIELGPLSHTWLRARDHFTSSTLIGGQGAVGPSSLHTTLEGPTEYVNARWMHAKVYMDSYMASNGSCSMVTWTISKPTSRRYAEHKTGKPWYTEISSIDLSCFIMCEDFLWIETHWNSIWFRARSHSTSHYTWGIVSTLHDLGSHNFMVMALGSCVKWPLNQRP